VNVKEVLIYKFHEGVFHSKLICEKDGQQSEIDSRTSDAIAIGVRFNAPIFTLGKILDEVGGAENANEDTFDFEDEDEDDPIFSAVGNEWKDVDLDELSNQLTEAIENEDYELASKIRDEIKRRG
jgi:bifunctional DNase/RNase